MSEGLDKGGALEEALRYYFIKAGYFALRSVKVRYDEFDVTDVDIWLYERPSSVSRHRIIVDAKNKKTPQAIERIFWTKGLKSALGVEQAIVATTDRRSAVSAYGREQDVLVLDGAFLARLLPALDGHLALRISEEEFSNLLQSYTYGQGQGGWKDRYDRAKSLVLDSLGYHSINVWLDEAKYFLEQSLIISSHSQAAMRAFYSISSLMAIGFDFVIKDAAFVDPKSKSSLIASGLRYGDGGKDGATKALEMALALIDNYAGAQGLSNRIRHGVEADFQSVDVAPLAEFFSRGSVAAGLFNVARELETAAFSRSLVSPSDLSVEGQSLLAVLADWWGIDRRKLFDGQGSSMQKASLPQVPEEVVADPTSEAPKKRKRLPKQEKLI